MDVVDEDELLLPARHGRSEGFHGARGTSERDSTIPDSNPHSIKGQTQKCGLSKGVNRTGEDI